MSGGWIQTYTGRVFYPIAPNPDDIDPADIGHALSMLCRYGGHSRRFYSVAEHCVLMSHAVTPESAAWALLHDAGEGLGLVDLPRPVKAYLRPYRQMEAAVMAAVCTRFGLPRDCPAEVTVADLRILRDERRTLLTPSPRPWSPEIEGVPDLGVDIACWSPDKAERMFLDRLADVVPAYILKG